MCYCPALIGRQSEFSEARRGVFTFCAKMATDSAGNRYVVFTLLFFTGVLAYFYWQASASATVLYVEIEERTQQWMTANRTVATLRYQLDNCKAQVCYLDCHPVLTCTEPVLKIMDAGYCLYVHIFVFF